VQGMVEDSICSIMLLDDSGVLNVAAAPSVGQELIESLNGLVPCAAAGSCGTAVYEKKPVYVADTSTDPRWEPLQDIATQYGIKACWSVPIFSREQEVLGSFAISHLNPRAPTEAHKQLLRTASHLAGIAIERNRLVELLRASERKYQDLFDNAPDMFASVSATTAEVLACNRTLLETLGYEESELLGRPILEIYDDSCHEELQRVFKRFSETGESASDELRLKRADGGTIDVGLKVSAVRDEAGRILCCRSIWRDITERKRNEEAMRQSQKLEGLGVLASGIAHDFNNLLVGIMGNASIAQHELPAGSEVHKAIASIEEASQRASELTSQLLAYAGRGKLSVQELNLADLAGEMAKLLSSATKIPMNVHPSSQAPWIKGDATQLRQVLMNLLTNAADASLEIGVPISIRTGVTVVDEQFLGTCIFGHDLPTGEYAFVEVEDHGCGMTPEVLSKIFDPFFTTKSKGRGLGLAATIGIVKCHKGTMWVESKPDRGTTFRLLCPLVRHTAGASGPTRKPSASIAGATVLVVDDEDAVLSVLTTMLTQAGCKVVSATSGQEAIVAAKRNGQIDIAILDITMPGMSGQETFRAIRGLRSDLPVVFSSGQSPEDYADLIGANLLTAPLPKPFNRDGLQSTLSELLQLSERKTTVN
jgi:two-component system cell cycle sensor histidine kinase/response regulator CckA